MTLSTLAPGDGWILSKVGDMPVHHRVAFWQVDSQGMVWAYCPTLLPEAPMVPAYSAEFVYYPS